MRIVFLLLAAVSLLALLIFAVENVNFYVTYNLFNSLNQSGIVMVPIAIGGFLGGATGFFLALFTMTKQNREKTEEQEW